MSIERRLTRRRLLAAAGITISGIGSGLACPRLVFAQTKKAVHFTLPWVAEGSNLFTFVAKGMGFWEKHGLDVDIARGSGSVAAAQAIGEGRFDFGMASPSAAILQTVKGLPMVALAHRNTGSLPWKRATRRRRRNRFAKCEPNTPLYVCNSSITT